MVTYCRGNTYVCFSQMSDEPKVLERFTANDYLVRYKEQWCGNGLKIPLRWDIVRSPKADRAYQEERRNTSEYLE